MSNLCIKMQCEGTNHTATGCKIEGPDCASLPHNNLLLLLSMPKVLAWSIVGQNSVGLLEARVTCPTISQDILTLR